MAESFHVELSKVRTARGGDLWSLRRPLREGKCFHQVEEDRRYYGREYIHEMVPGIVRRIVPRTRF